MGSDVELNIPRKTRPSRGDDAGGEEAEVGPSYQDHPRDRTVRERRRVDGVSVETADALDAQLPTLQAAIQDATTADRAHTRREHYLWWRSPPPR